MKRLFAVCFFVVSVVSSASARPVLADAYSQPVWLGGGEVVQSVLADDAWTADAAASVEPELSPEQSVVLARRQYESGMRMYRTGNVMAGVGLGVGVASFALGAVVARNDLGAGFVILVLGIGTGSIALYTGSVLSTVGALRATSAVNRGLGAGLDYTLVIASFIAIGTGVLGVPWAGALVAVGFNALQVGKIRRGLERMGLADVHIGPAPNGLAIAGRF